MMNATTNAPPLGPPAGEEDPSDPKNPEQKNVDNSAITVAAPAASLILVLVAIVVWFFLVRKQLRKNAKESKRLGSKRSHSGSFKDSRHSSIKASRLSQQGSSPFSTPKSHRKSGGSPKDKHRSCNCTCKVDHEDRQEEMCTCGVPHSPMATAAANGISAVCTGNSPFCPHSNKMRHFADIHSRGSSISFDLNDLSPLSEHASNVITYERRGRANTGDISTLPNRGKVAKDSEDVNMVLRRSMAGYPLKNCTCHPLNGLERKPCSCALKHPLSHIKRKVNEDDLYFSAPSLVHKQFNMC